MNHVSRSRTLFALALAVIASMALQSPALAASNRHKAVARLWGPTPMKGKAVYEQRPKSGTTLKKFKVEVERGIPFQTHQVFVNGQFVGSLTTNAGGRGKLQLRTAEFIDSAGDGSPIPSNFPKLDTGDTVTVGPLTGVVFDRRDNSVQKYELRGRLDGNSSEDGKVRYRERYKNGGLMRRFEIEVEDAGSQQVLDVYVNNVFVTSITTNNRGDADFEYRTGSFIDSPGDGIPMPSTFPSLQPGDEVRVGNMNTTLILKD